MSGRELTVPERESLAQHEATIERGLHTFYEVGAALLAIRDARLYRATHGTFEDYCRERWGMTRRHANRLVASAEVVGNLGPVGPIPPANERQIRPLAALPPEQQREAWSLAVETAPEGRVSAAHVAAVVERVRHPDPPPPPAPRPSWRARRVARDEALRLLNQTMTLYLEIEYAALCSLAERRQLPRDVIEALQMVAATD